MACTKARNSGTKPPKQPEPPKLSKLRNETTETIETSNETKGELETAIKTIETDSMGAYHLAKKSGNFGLESNGKAIFRKIFSEIVDNLQR